jgi:ornithine cyclodeaminase
VLVATRSRPTAEAFAAWVRDTLGLEAAPAAPAEVSAAPIVAACTTNPTPVVVDGAVGPGAHVNAVGAFTPTTRELPSGLIARARVYVDTRAGATAEAGDLRLPAQEGVFRPEAVVGELGEVLLGRAPGRRSAAEITVYKSVGAAFLDAATAGLAYRRAAEGGHGQEFAFA